MAKVLGIGEVFCKAHNPRQLVDWCANWLGLKLDPAFTGTVFHAVKLPEKSCTVWVTFPQDSDYFDPSTHSFMYNLIVDDLAGALQQVTMGGAMLVGEPQGLEDGIFRWFMDPEGNNVELWQPR